MSWDLDAMSVLPEGKQNDVMENFSPQYLAEVLSEHITEIQEQKPVVDEQKREMAESVIKADNYCIHDGYKCPFHCDGSGKGHRTELIHDEFCPVTKAEKYLKGLEAE